MAAHIANRDNVTVREFISEFRGMTGTAKQKVVLAETGASHVSLHNYLRTAQGQHREHREAAGGAEEAHQAGAARRAWRHRQGPSLSVGWKRAGGDPKTFTYNRTSGDTSGLPRVIEFAFGIHRGGLEADNEHCRKSHW